MNESGYTIDQKEILPSDPGVYKFFDVNNKLIYVGKAKNLKKRVYSYFNKLSGHNRKTQRLVSDIKFFDFTIVNSEVDALLLENNLIKANQPKYNILLKDDKTFPYICITNERFPRIISTRTLNKKTGEYFGPYSSVVSLNTVLDLIRKLYTIRTCTLNLSSNNIEKKKFKICLEYHIGNCKGPCEGLQSLKNYNKDIESAKHILKGSLSEVKNHFKDKMKEASENLEFEEAQKFKEKLDLVEKFQGKSTVVNPKLSNLVVFTIIENDLKAYVNFLFIENGSIIKTKSIEIKKALNETPDLILQTVAFDVIKDVNTNLEILSNVKFNIGSNESTIPIIGDKKKLIDLSLKNAFEYKKNNLLNKPIHDKSIIVLEQLKKDLSLKEIPNHIECFDNSNIQGTNPVASMVCFRNAKPSKKDYRHYNIKTVIGPDDFASMKEVVGRRYKRLLNENMQLPNLIVIDGGKGQLSMAMEALKELDLYGRIPVIGIAKRLEEIYFPNDKYPLHISKKSSSLAILQHLRDEAHRFAITFHRQKRSNSSLKTQLEEIQGIGKASIEKLLIEFKSIQKVKMASKKEIESIIGNDKAQKVYTFLQKKRG